MDILIIYFAMSCPCSSTMPRFDNCPLNAENLCCLGKCGLLTIKGNYPTVNCCANCPTEETAYLTAVFLPCPHLQRFVPFLIHALASDTSPGPTGSPIVR